MIATTENAMNASPETTVPGELRQASRALVTSQRGMTLVEIMIVLTIMASIMGMVGVFVVGALDNAKIKEAQTQVEQYASFVEQYYVFQGSWPDSLDQLQRPPGGMQPLIERLDDDPWGNPYNYRKGGDRGYELCSSGKDGSSGGGDDICAGGSGGQ